MEKRSVVKIENEDIVLEIFKNEDGAIVRQQSFTKGNLEMQKNQLIAGLGRVNGMLALMQQQQETVG